MPLRYAADGSVALASEPKELRPFAAFGRSREYVLEQAISTDYGLVRAAVGDRHGNLRFEKSARNFNPLAGMAGRLTIAEVDELVEPGELGPGRHPPARHLRRPGRPAQPRAVGGPARSRRPPSAHGREGS